MLRILAGTCLLAPAFGSRRPGGAAEQQPLEPTPSEQQGLSIFDDDCLATDHGKPVIWDRQKCRGLWSPWKDCNTECYRSRTFNLTVDEGCPSNAFKTGEVEYAICSSAPCKLTDKTLAERDIGKDFREAVFEFGLPSKRVEALGHLINNAQVWIHAGVIIILCIVAFMQSLQLEWLPDICVAIPIAACFALVLRFHTFHGVNFGMALNSVFGTVVSRVMNDFLIPISLFEGAYHVQRLNFYSQFWYGLVFACIGTGFSAALIAAMVKYTGEWGFHPVSGWREAVAYAAFIADVDPVATLAIFGNLKADALLATMVAGEATLNDPIAIVIFNVCNVREKNFDFVLSDEVKNGIILLVGSISLGLFSGVFFSTICRVMRVRGRGPLETAYVFLSAYGGYAMGEWLNMSGIIVTLFSGLIMGVYTNRVVEDKDSVDSFLNVSARIADLMMFVIIGFSVFVIDDVEGVKLGLWTILFCFVARAIMIAVLVPLVNIAKSMVGAKTLSFGTAFMMWHSGLRGGMTVMMALMIDPYWSENQNCLLNATLVCVIGLSYLCGTTGPTFMRLFNIPMNVPQEDGSLYVADPNSYLHRADVFITTSLGFPNLSAQKGRSSEARTSEARTSEARTSETARRASSSTAAPAAAEADAGAEADGAK
eukprot:TRINITY_DN5903_c0_g2_i1.p1 TRINITY_DN5903_c0_g2~~TRINITY_DN5903_c0_g2_i1.p1  ORF type:complete len:653 (+),score=174.28 TRINITY_DN5903_c0_g2_i1:62-2020(+)